MTSITKGIMAMHSKRPRLYAAIVTAVFLLAMAFAANAASVPRMSAEELKLHLAEGDVLVLDVRANRDWLGSSDKIVGAERVDPGNINLWAKKYSGEKKIVLYCA